MDNFNKITLIIIILTKLITINESVYTRQELDSIPTVNYNLANASHTDVFYYFFENSTQIDGILIENDGLLWEFNGDVPTKFFFHGYTTNYQSPWYPLLKQSYFKKGQHNIFYVDWSKAGNLEYEISSANIRPIGEFIADFIIKTKLPLEQIHLFGHSLGCPLTGFVGKSIYAKTGRKLARITALDAVGPGFDRLTNDNLRLRADDAEFVDAIHTDIDYFGFKRPFGHVDFYVNGGVNQPGCKREIDDNCSHARSTLLFVASIGNVGIRAQPARFIDEMVEIVDGGVVGFGDNLNGSERGVYFIKTTDKAPFFLN